MSDYRTITALRAGKTVNVDGKNYRMVDGKEWGEHLNAGDLYIGERNTVRVSTVSRVDRENGWVMGGPEFVYPFDLGEVVGVEEVIVEEIIG